MTEQATKQNNGKLVKASARHIHIAPRKMRLVTNLIKNMNAMDAIVQLQHANKKAAPIVIKLLQSAIANAKNNFSLDPQFLFIKSITADQGKEMKRYFPRARGSAFVIRRKMSHVNVVLEEKKKAKASKTKLGFLKKTEGKEVKPENVDQQDAVSKKPVNAAPKKSQVFKTDEEVKMNKVANKRRLFNRKTGV
ncbi:MAG: 50S ribosomal protein L22 [Candidatus Doudnabacteria bacterium]|nr:50S ribosomal protein L22 [Candidatus Doudnabacteria bacterium]